jgi:Uma2 family endonuclease
MSELLMHAKAPATLEDLARVPGKAELVNGEIVHMPPTGDGPGVAGDQILVSLWQYVAAGGVGLPVGDNKAFRVNLPHRQSFSPDAALYTGPRTGMKFFSEAPVFAVEVRSEGDYRPRAEEAMAAKRADYFAAGTKVVWDVDLLGQDVVRKFVTPDAEKPAQAFRRGETADAEPAVPEWRMAVDDLFR